jgi:Domain of unknown function (DUF6471)
MTKTSYMVIYIMR